MSPDAGAGIAGLERHRTALVALEDEVERLIAGGEPERAAARAASAARFAWLSHPGVHASRRLEAALAEIGRRALGPPPTPRRSGHLVHVMSEAAAVGGHVPLVERWIRRNPHGRSVLALTRHGRALPPALWRAVEESGATVARLGGRRDGLLARAEALRAVAAGAESVVLHLHPDDVVPSLAFAGWPGRPPVAHMNHADHCFWIGLGTPDLVVHIRDHGARQAERRRGVPAARSIVLPLPIDPPAPASRDAVRRELGLAPETVVLLVAASAYKLAGGHPHLLDLVEPVLAGRPEAVLLAAGADPAGRFAEAADRLGRHRVRALGFRSDLPALMRGADVFLDAFPCASLTAALEAAAAGLPLLSYQPERPGGDMLDTDAPALGALHLRPGNPDSYGFLLARLIEDVAWRREVGAGSRAATLTGHAGGGWGARAAEVRQRLAQAAADGPPGFLPPEDDAPDGEDLALLALHERSGVTITVDRALAGEPAMLGTPGAPDLSVVIVADRREALLGCLDAAVTACEDAGDVEAIVVDNAGRDGTAEALAAMSGDLRAVRLEAPAREADAFALGAGMADGDLVLLLAQDARPTAGELAALRDALGRMDGEEAVGTEDGAMTLARGDAARAGARVTPRLIPLTRRRWEPDAPCPDPTRSAPA